MAPPREGSRRSLFEAVERVALKPLPAEPFEIGEWQIDCKVNVDYHIAGKTNCQSSIGTLIWDTPPPGLRRPRVRP